MLYDKHLARLKLPVWGSPLGHLTKWQTKQVRPCSTNRRNDWAFRQRDLQVFCLKWIESFESHHLLTVFFGTDLGPQRPYTSWVQLTITLPDSLPLKIGLIPKGRPDHLPTVHFSGAKNVRFREGNGLKFWKFLLLERSSIQTLLYIGAPAIPTIWHTSSWRHRLNLPCKRFPFV